MLRPFDIFNHSLAPVLTKITRVNLYSEASSLAVKNLHTPVLEIIEFGHAFNLEELNIVAILVRMTRFFVQLYDWVHSLLNTNYYELLRGLSVLVSNDVFGAIV